MKDPISGRLLTGSILSILDNLPLVLVVQIRDKCNDLIASKGEPIFKEPEEFKTWRVRHSDST